MEVYMTDAGDQQMKLQLRALDESLAESGRLHKLTELAAIDPGMPYLFAAPAHCQQLAYIRVSQVRGRGRHTFTTSVTGVVYAVLTRSI